MDEVTMARPKKEYLNNTKLVSVITSGGSNPFQETLEITTIPKKNVFITVDLTADEKLSLSNPNITAYDLAVMDSVYTLFINGNAAFTPEMIVRVMTGNMDADVTAQKKAAVTRSLKKLRHIDISIDCTNELKARKKLQNGETGKLKSYLLPLDEIEIKSANHQTVMNGFALIKKPAIYSYAETVSQIISVPTELLETTSISNTDDVIIIKRYLIRRIELMKDKKNNMHSHKIIYEWHDAKTDESKGMFQALGYKQSDYSNWRKKRNELHGMVTSILEEFVKDGYIRAYEIEREGRQKISGVKILLEEEGGNTN